MLGRNAETGYKTVGDFKNHIDYLNYMYGSTNGFVSRATIHHKSDLFSERLFSNEWLIEKNAYYGQKNVYTSLNTFISPKKGRKTGNLKVLNSLYIDIDCYKADLTQEQVLFLLEQDYFDKIIPTPTFVINSGRGLYLIYKIKEDCNALPRWQRVQRFLFKQLEDLGADSQALDAARILRVPFTINTKSGTMVKIERFNDITYTLYDIIQEYNVPYDSRKPKVEYGKATARQKEVAQWQAKAFGVELPNFNSYDDTFNFIHKYSEKKISGKEKTIVKKKSFTDTLNNRINDLFTLFGELRTGVDCCREYALFLCRLWAIEKTGDYEYALKTTLALNSSLDKPFSMSYVTRTTKSAETKCKNGESYHYSTRKIIEVLQITEEEQKKLRSLRTNDGSKKKEQNRQNYLKKLQDKGQTTKSAKIEKRRSQLIQLAVKGKNKKEICNILNISLRTYDRDYKEVKEIINQKKAEKKKSKSAHDNTNKCSIKRVKKHVRSVTPKIQPIHYRGTKYRNAFVWKTSMISTLFSCVFIFDSSDDFDSS